MAGNGETAADDSKRQRKAANDGNGQTATATADGCGRQACTRNTAGQVGVWGVGNPAREEGTP